MKFSELLGIRKVKVDIQLQGLDRELRNALWDHYSTYIFRRGFRFETFGIKTTTHLESWVRPYFNTLWHTLFKDPIDTCPINNYERLYSDMRERILRGDWYDVYDLLEYTSQYFEDNDFDSNINAMLERELSGYCLINRIISPITDKQQVSAIENAVAATSALSGINKHLVTALDLLSDRKNPDHRNSIKESISAVEGLCQIIANDSKAELGKALRVIETKMPIHEALKKAFLSMYGYTSNSSGIRHAMLELPDLHLEDSLYFLVVCSSFISFLISKCERYKIKISV